MLTSGRTRAEKWGARSGYMSNLMKGKLRQKAELTLKVVLQVQHRVCWRLFNVFWKPFSLPKWRRQPLSRSQKIKVRGGDAGGCLSSDWIKWRWALIDAMTWCSVGVVVLSPETGYKLWTASLLPFFDVVINIEGKKKNKKKKEKKNNNNKKKFMNPTLGKCIECSTGTLKKIVYFVE